jgi:hypothetical protein
VAESLSRVRLTTPSPETWKIVLVQPAGCGFSEIGQRLLDRLIATPMVLDLGQDHAQTLCVYFLWGPWGPTTADGNGDGVVHISSPAT